MSKIQLLRVFLNERLAVAVDEIFGAVEKTITEYQEEVSRSKDENDRLQRLLEIALKPELKLHRADLQQLTFRVSEEEVHPDQQKCVQEWSPSLGQEDPEFTQIKEEQEEPRTSQWEEQLQGLEDDTKDSIFIPACVKGDCDENPTLHSYLYHGQNEVNGERVSLPSTSTKPINTEPYEEDYLVSELTSDSHTLAAVDCSAVQRENSATVNGMESGVPQSGFKRGKSNKTWTVKRQSSRANNKGRNSTKSSILKSPSQSHNAPCHCKVCGMSFHYMGSLVNHVQTHTMDKEHPCGVCGKCIESTESMKDHLQIHSAAKFSCKVCSKCFTRNSKLTVHMRTHTGEKPHHCRDCGHRFSTGSHLRVHMRTHTGEKPYVCPDCGIGFFQSEHLKAHIRIHTGEKPYHCRFCDKCFRTGTNLTGHMRTHRGEII
ncbi:zinc finger protein with KRAB and SCAN domains 8-like [Oncorhynchus keta]|uniref:zinc finger protein with KRAB and SCAN domains 8-like n=1 Tax=Oncorhynchus keta TaxID=8018 RepID=UPI0015FBF880|nr:zinc finger protein with KRAB and SCAN domains 8-like [Oncorhynchus keta]